MNEDEMYLKIEEKVDDIKDLLISNIKINEDTKKCLEWLIDSLKGTLEDMEIKED